MNSNIADPTSDELQTILSKFLTNSLPLNKTVHLSADFNEPIQAINRYAYKVAMEVIGEDEDITIYDKLPGFQKDAWARNIQRNAFRTKLAERLGIQL